MPPTAPPPTAADLAELTRLHGAARYLDAFHFAQPFAPLEDWPGTEALILAGRLVSCWGDWARSNRIHTRAWREAPADPGAIFYQTLTLEHRHGPFEALRFLHEQRPLLETNHPTKHHVWLWLQQARLLATFRDFEGADALLQRAQPHAAGAADPWWWVERARLFEQQDRYEEALASADEALRLRPRYRQAFETKAHLLILRNRDDEALALLREALEHLQAANLAQMLAVHLDELEQYGAALAALDQAVAWLPCADRTQRAWFAARRSDALRRLGRTAEAIAAAKEVKYPFHDHVAAQLAAPPADRRRVHLRVGFVRQHHMTCAPATLTALGGFWQRPVDHLKLAQLICYDGTPDHEERHWAESHGWIVREFRVTWDVAVTLLDRGCPFTLTTVAPRSAHLQAVVGYDAALGLLLIRDPYQRTHGECIGRSFIESCASHGPRGMVLVPADRAGLLDGIEFPDAALYDRWFALRRAVARHDRSAASAECDRLLALAPGHRLAHLAQRELALYDGNLVRQLEATRALLALYPDDPNFLLDEAQFLRALGRSAEHRERVAALGRRRQPDPLFLRECAEMLATDARTHVRAHKLFRRVLRRRGVDAWNLRAFGHLLWAQRQFAPAAEVYRLAACAGDKTEAHWDTYFSASRHLRTAEACLALLRQREARLGAQSGQPVRTLFRALDALDQTPAGFAALDAALARRPDDGELRLFAVECRARFGQRDEAARLLAAAEGRSPRRAWVRTAAHLAELRADHAAALGHWRELLALNPVDLDAHRSTARLIAILEGRVAALEFLREACARHPSQLPLQTLRLEWLRTEPPAAALAVVDHLLALDPTDAWTLREKALILGRDRRHDEALALAETARRIEPHAPSSAGVHGLVLVALGRTTEARGAFEDALKLGLDPGYMSELVSHSADFAARCAAIAFLREEIVRQPLPDDGAFLRFRELARTVLAPDETRAALEAVLAAHPDQWAAWSALGTHLLDQGQTEAGLARAREAADRFPLVHRVWLDLANAQSQARQSEAEIESLRRALALSPGWGQASRALALAHERALQLDAAEHVHRRALAADPLDGVSHAHLADLLWRRSRPAEALPLMERALALDPGFDWAWERLDEWAKTTADTGRAVTLATAVTVSRPGDSQAWLRLARLQSHEPATALATLERALPLNPRDIDLHDFRAQLLGAAGRHDEALAACRPATFGDTPPRELQGRAAWIEHTRGHVAPAIDQMRLVVKAHPDYLWGWTCLTEWLWAREEPQPTLEAATQWAWLAPFSPTPLAYLSAAHQRMGHRREAKDALWRALHCDPTYVYSAQTLLKWLSEDRDLDEATRLLRHIETHFSPADAQRSTVLYHIMRKDRTAAATAFAALARAPAERQSLIQECVAALTEAGWCGVIEDALAPLLTEPGINPKLARFWVEAWGGEIRWKKLRQLERRQPPDPVLRCAWAAVLEQLGRNGAVWRLRWIRYRRRDWLRGDAETWGSLGYAFVTSGLRRAAIAWLEAWPKIPQLRPWMLYNLVLAYYQRKKPAPAFGVVQHALTLPADGTRHDFLVWLGLEQALRGSTAAATESLAQTASAALDPQARLLRGFTQLVVDFDPQRGFSPGTALREAKQKLAALWAEHASAGSDPGLVHFRARVLRHFADRSGSWVTRIQSHLPPKGRQYTAPAAKNSFGDYWWVVWFAVVLFSSLVRNCSAH
ncbi:MAG: tetratricopeptide repeat protein [Verrucomicrobia bacterium]|nr:tetratricopeptide repeat protein [Verrucomicrobiota bacterium]